MHFYCAHKVVYKSTESTERFKKHFQLHYKMNKLVFVAVFLAVVCCLAYADPVNPKGPKDIYELTVDQVETFTGFAIKTLASVEQSLEKLAADIGEFLKWINGDKTY